MKAPLRDRGDSSGKLLFENKDQHLVPSAHPKAEYVVSACYPSTGEAETAGSLGLIGQPS